MFNGFALLIQKHNQHAVGREVSDDLITHENVFNLLLSLTKGNKTDQLNVSILSGRCDKNYKRYLITLSFVLV